MRKKLPYQGGFTKLLCQKKAAWHKKQFQKNVLQKDNFDRAQLKEINFEIISFSGAKGFEDQVLSIYSFLYYAGVPIKWTLYSDKSYTQEQKDILKKKFSFVSITDWDVNNYCSNSKILNDYLKICGLAKKLTAIISHPYFQQTIYLDSDIILYKNISFYLSSGLLNKGLWYASDTLGNVNDYFNSTKESLYPLNSGLLILNDTFNADDIFYYFENLNGKYEYFSEQSSFEFAFRRQDANILDPRQFINDPCDQFDFNIKFDPRNIAMRHYTNPVRHKMWQKGWQWHFKA